MTSDGREASGGRRASFLRRVGALAIDVAAIYALDFVITLPVGSVLMARGGPTVAMVEEAVRWPLIAAYLIGFWATGSTPGMRSLGLELVANDGGRPGPILAAVRFVVFGGWVFASGMLWLLPLVPYAIVCAIGFYPHDVVARTNVRDSGFRSSSIMPAADGRDRESTPSQLINALVRAFLFVMLGGLAIGVIFGGIGDAGYAAYVRNDTGGPLTLSYAFDSRSDRPVTDALAPGATTSVAKVGGPRESPRLLIKAYDTRGALVFCREFAYDDYRTTGPSSPIGIRTGDLTCR